MTDDRTRPDGEPRKPTEFCGHVWACSCVDKYVKPALPAAPSAGLVEHGSDLVVDLERAAWERSRTRTEAAKTALREALTACQCERDFLQEQLDKQA